jgi:hypothetical protein
VSEILDETPQQHQVHLQIRPAVPELLNVNMLSALWHVARLIEQHTAQWRQSLGGDNVQGVAFCLVLALLKPN